MPPTGSQQQTHVKVANPVMFGPEARPFALLYGRSVRIVGQGDVEGKSLCNCYVGADLKMNWESQSLFTIIDPQYLPASEIALTALGQALTDASANTTTHR